eukprot:6200780-Pleurochrysis_carterae.AAC.6
MAPRSGRTVRLGNPWRRAGSGPKRRAVIARERPPRHVLDGRRGEQTAPPQCDTVGHFEAHSTSRPPSERASSLAKQFCLITAIDHTAIDHTS